MLATVRHIRSDVVEVALEGEVEPLHPTASHLFYSVDRGTWIPAFELTSSEWIAADAGAVQVRSVTAVEGGHAVFNIEVETSGTYFVSPAHVLTHNINPCAWWRGSLISEGVSTGEQLAVGRSPLHVHDDYVRWVLDERAIQRTFPTPWSASQGLGTRRFDGFDKATQTYFEGNTTPWSEMTQQQLSRKLDQAASDFTPLHTNQRIKRIVWFGTEELPTTGLGAQLREALDAAGIPYWVVAP